MCNAYNLRHRNEAILDIARAMQLPLNDLPDFPPRHRIGIKQHGLILRPIGDGPLAWSWAHWSLVPPGAKQLPPYPLNNARADKLGSWPWKSVQRQRCLIPASGFWEPEKLAREKGVAPWSYYSMTDGRPFFMAGLWAEASDPATGEVADTYSLIITDANATMRVHDRMPAILATHAVRRWIEPGPLPAELLAPYPAEEMIAWQVADDADRAACWDGRAGVVTLPCRAIVLAAVSALALSACAGTPVQTSRLVPGELDTVEDRISAAMTDLGLTAIVNEGRAITGRAVRAPDNWAACPPALVGRGGGEHTSRRFVSVGSRQASVQVAFMPEGGATKVDVKTAFSATYYNPERGGSFDRPCRSKGILEARILEAAG